MKFTQKRVFAYTQPHSGLANVLISDIGVVEAFDPNLVTVPPPIKTYKGIWDTGASCTVINSRIVSELGLKASGKMWVSAVGDNGQVNRYLADTYSINIFLPNKFQIIGVVAAKGEPGVGDALIGMDVISTGDFAITNVNGDNKNDISFPFDRGDRFCQRSK